MNWQFRLRLAALLMLALVILAAAWWFLRTEPEAPIVVPRPLLTSDEAVLVGAGDIASCDVDGDEATAKLIAALPDAAVFTLGDNVYDNAEREAYERCYGASWGAFKERTWPALGNHDYVDNPEATGYKSYFGPRVTTDGRGYYAYDLAAWRVIVLDSNCDRAGGCGFDSPQGRWLSHELRTHAQQCTLAYWHHPLFNSGDHGPAAAVRPFWDLLYRFGADVVLNGHAHSYERFAPQSPDGNFDAVYGIREFVVGTGGYSHKPMAAAMPNSEARNDDTFGVLKLNLRPGDYDWQFLPVSGQTFTDAGHGICHSAP